MKSYRVHKVPDAARLAARPGNDNTPPAYRGLRGKNKSHSLVSLWANTCTHFVWFSYNKDVMLVHSLPSMSYLQSPFSMQPTAVAVLFVTFKVLRPAVAVLFFYLQGIASCLTLF